MKNDVRYVLPIVSAILCFYQSFTKLSKEQLFSVPKLSVKMSAIPRRIVAHPIAIVSKQPVSVKQSGSSYNPASDSVAHATTLYSKIEKVSGGAF